MLKSLKDHSLARVVLLFFVLISGIGLRCYHLDKAGGQGPEIAAFYFAKNLEAVFFMTSETPLYFALCRLWLSATSLTLFSLKSFSVAMSFLTLFISSILLWKNRGLGFSLIFLTIWWLSPVDIRLSRLGDSNSFFSELSVLAIILFHYRKSFSHVLSWLFWSFYQFLNPFGCLLLLVLLGWEAFKKRTSASELRYFFTTALPVIVYYLVRFIFFGSDVLKNFPLPPIGVLGICALLLAVKSLSVRTSLLISLFLLGGLSFYGWKMMKPWTLEAGSDRSVESYKAYYKTLTPRSVVICASGPELDYYFQLPFSHCSTEVLKLHLKKQSFYLLSLHGDDELLIKFLTTNTKVERKVSFNRALFLSVIYPPRK